MHLDPGCFHAFEQSLELLFVQLELLNHLVELGEVNATVLLAVREKGADRIGGSFHGRPPLLQDSNPVCA